MANYSRPTMVRVGRLLNRGQRKPDDKVTASADLTKLAEWLAVARKAIYNWSLAPDHPQFRAMSPMSKRFIATLAYFSVVMDLNDQRLKEIEAIEEALGDEAQSTVLSRRLAALLRATAPGEKDEPEAPPAPV